MPGVIVYDRDGNGIEVSDETAARLVGQGTHTMEPGQSITVTNPIGGRVSVSGQRYHEDSGLKPYTSREDADRMAEERFDREHDTVGSKAKAFGGGLLSGLSLGLAEPWAEDQSAHRGYAFAGDAVATIGTLLIPGAGEANVARLGAKGVSTAAKGIRLAEEGATVVRGVEEVVAAERAAAGIGRRAVGAVGSALERTPLAYVNRIGREAAGIVRGESRLANVARAGIAAATVGGIEGGTRELGRQLHSDEDLNVEGIFSSAFKGAVVGGGLGVGGAALSEGLGALGSRFARAEKPLSKAAIRRAERERIGMGIDEYDAVPPPQPGVLSRAKDAITSVPGSVMSALPGGRMIGNALQRGGPTALALAAIQEGGLGQLASMVGTAAPAAIGAAVAGKTLRKLFADPVVGGRTVAHASQILDAASLFPGDRPAIAAPRDIRRAAASFAGRVRSTTADQASLAATNAVGPSADPAKLIRVQEAARVRHRLFTDLVDSEIPAPRSAAGTLLGGRLPSQQSARRVVEIVRVATEPMAFARMAAEGRLSSRAYAAAQTLWPAHVEAVRQRLLDWLSTGPRMASSERRSVERLLGPTLLDRNDSRHVAYSRAMAASHARARTQAAPMPKPSTSGGGRSVPLDPAAVAADPTSRR